MITFINDHRGAHGVEPICKVLPIAPSTYHDHAAKRAGPEKLSERAKRDMGLKPEITRVFKARSCFARTESFSGFIRLATWS